MIHLVFKIHYSLLFLCIIQLFASDALSQPALIYTKKEILGKPELIDKNFISISTIINSHAPSLTIIESNADSTNGLYWEAHDSYLDLGNEQFYCIRNVMMHCLNLAYSIQIEHTILYPYYGIGFYITSPYPKYMLEKKRLQFFFSTLLTELSCKENCLSEKTRMSLISIVEQQQERIK